MVWCLVAEALDAADYGVLAVGLQQWCSAFGVVFGVGYLFELVWVALGSIVRRVCGCWLVAVFGDCPWCVGCAAK
ncbi:hypothetical protein Droror1_Dr00008420, partial [Drosera rotundifolia]